MSAPLRVSLLVMAKRMNLSLSEMACIDVDTLLMASEAWAGHSVDYTRQATQADIDRFLS